MVQSRRRWGSRVGLIAFSLLLLLAILVYGTTYFGHIQGEEFSPFTFQRREFTYYEVPLVRIQVSPVKRVDSTGTLEDFLTTEKLLPKESKADGPDRWDLVRAFRAGSPAGFGEAEILCNYLESVDSNEDTTWLEWSHKQPKLAKIVWPLIATLARKHLYILVPDVLIIARESTDPDQLQAELDRQLAAEFLTLAEKQQQLGKNPEAIELFSDALAHHSDLIEALKGRAKAYSAEGDDERARQDRARIRELQSNPNLSS